MVELAGLTEIAGVVRYRAGVPVYRYRSAPQTPPVSVLRIGADGMPGHGQQRHIHDFPVLLYVERARRLATPGDPARAVRDQDTGNPADRSAARLPAPDPSAGAGNRR